MSWVCVGCPAPPWAGTACGEFGGSSEFTVRNANLIQERQNFYESNRNILVVFYEGGIEPEVERDVFVSFWKTLNGFKPKDKPDHGAIRLHTRYENVVAKGVK